MFLTIVTFGRDRLMETGRNGESYAVSEKKRGDFVFSKI